jgi:hypothetical protein
VPQATVRSSSFVHSLHVWRGRHHTKAINSMSDKDLDLKPKTEQRQTSLEVWNAGREYEYSVDLYFGNRGGDEARRSENTTSIAQEAISEAILEMKSPRFDSSLQRHKIVVRSSSNPNPKAILAFLASVRHRQRT